MKRMDGPILLSITGAFILVVGPILESAPMNDLGAVEDDARVIASCERGEARDIAEVGRGVVLREYGRRCSVKELREG